METNTCAEQLKAVCSTERWQCENEQTSCIHTSAKQPTRWRKRMGPICDVRENLSTQQVDGGDVNGAVAENLGPCHQDDKLKY